MSTTQTSGPGQLGKYEIRGTLGRGAMGTVYDGWDPRIARRVAIKTVRLADADDAETAEALARFQREAQAAGRLSHPNIVGVYDYGETDEIAYIVMEFVEGTSLKARIDEQKRLPPAEAATIMAQVLAGLSFSHARGVVHRDIKPANIMLTQTGQVKIADFGIARIESSSMTSVGTVMGTPAYMPPEQFLGEPVDVRSDIYAAGVMLFHMLTGERPYEGSMTSIMHKVLNTDTVPAPSARASVPRAFDAVVAKAMARAPGDRFPDADAFAQAIQAALAAPTLDDAADETMVAPRAKPVPQAAAVAGTPPGAAKRGMPVGWLAGGAALLLLAAGGAYVALRPGAPPASPSVAPAKAPAAAVTPAPSPAPLAPPTPAPSALRPPVSAVAKAPPAADAAAVQAAVAAALNAAPCSALAFSAPENDRLTINGLVGTGGQEQAVTQAVYQAAGQGGVDWQKALPVPAAYCVALDAIRFADAGPSGAPLDSLDISINGHAGRLALRDHDLVKPRIVMPGFAAWLSVDYLSNNGMMVHFYSSNGASTGPQRPGAVVKMTGKESNGIGPPFGRDLVVAVASEQRLLPSTRPKSETMAQYTAALAAAVKATRQQGHRVVATAIVVDTHAAR